MSLEPLLKLEYLLYSDYRRKKPPRLTFDAEVAAVELDGFELEEDGQVFKADIEGIPAVELVLMMVYVQPQLCLYIST